MIIAAGITLIILAAFYFYGNYREQVGVDKTIATLTVDSTITKTDTVWAKADTVIKYEWIFVNVADVDTVEDVLTYSTQLDTTVIIDKDTVLVLTADISLTEGIFETLMKIDIRLVEKLVTVTKTIFQTVIKEVSVSEFPNTFLTGFISAVITIILVALALL